MVLRVFKDAELMYGGRFGPRTLRFRCRVHITHPKFKNLLDSLLRYFSTGRSHYRRKFNSEHANMGVDRSKMLPFMSFCQKKTKTIHN